MKCECNLFLYVFDYGIILILIGIDEFLKKSNMIIMKDILFNKKFYYIL